MKDELKFGVIISFLILALTGYYIFNYQKKLNQSPIIKPVATNVQNNTILTENEVAKHNSPQDCWMIVNKKVYSVTDYVNLHPGGAASITNYCGQDATAPFLTKGGAGKHSPRADQQHAFLYIGDLDGKFQTEPDKSKLKLPIFQKKDEDDDD